MTAQSPALDTASVKTEQDEWAQLYQQEMPRIYNFFRYRLQEEQTAEDLTAVTFEKAWRQRLSYQKNKAAFSTWLFTIAKNVAIDHMRQRHLLTEIGEHLPANTPSPEEALQQKEHLAQLRQLLDGLPERDQEIIALKFGAALNNREIARVTNLSAANIGIILFRTVRKLRRQWETHPMGENK
jgi:RNA polymerase sigma-70 factor (ECF subfamily)